MALEPEVSGLYDFALLFLAGIGAGIILNMLDGWIVKAETAIANS